MWDRVIWEKWLVFPFLLYWKGSNIGKGYDLIQVDNERGNAVEGRNNRVFVPQYRSGGCSDRGPRQTLEDALICIDDLHPQLHSRGAYYGVCVIISSSVGFCFHKWNYCFLDILSMEAWITLNLICNLQALREYSRARKEILILLECQVNIDLRVANFRSS